MQVPTLRYVIFSTLKVLFLSFFRHEFLVHRLIAELKWNKASELSKYPVQMWNLPPTQIKNLIGCGTPWEQKTSMLEIVPLWAIERVWSAIILLKSRFCLTVTHIIYLREHQRKVYGYQGNITKIWFLSFPSRLNKKKKKRNRASLFHSNIRNFWDIQCVLFDGMLLTKAQFFQDPSI